MRRKAWSVAPLGAAVLTSLPAPARSGTLTLPLCQGGQIPTNVALARVRCELQNRNLVQTRSNAQAAASAEEANLSQALFGHNAAPVSFHKATGTMEEYLK